MGVGFVGRSYFWVCVWCELRFRVGEMVFWFFWREGGLFGNLVFWCIRWKVSFECFL